MELRYYQDDALTALDAYFAEHAGNPLVAMPTGTGKSVVIAKFVQRCFMQWPGTRIVKLTHVQELVEQNFARLLSVWPSAPAGINCASLGRSDIAPITFASIQTVASKPAAFGHVDLVLIDEAHLVSDNDGSMYQKFIGALRAVNPKLKVIGFSATCWRIGMGHLTDGDLFTHVAYDITSRDAFNRLIAEAYIAPLIPRQTVTQIDSSGVHVRGGEFVQSELNALCGNHAVTYKALREMVEQGQDRKSWLVFTAGIANTEMVAEMLRDEFDIPAVEVHSKIGKDARRDAIDGFKSGRYRAAVNNNILTTGFDHPGVDLIGVLRPTQSAVLWVQMLGRGTRPVYAPGYPVGSIAERVAAIEAGPKQNCLVLDFAANTERIGPINDPVIPKKRNGSSGAKGAAPIKTCEQCQTYNHASVRFCVSCGFEFHQQIRYGAHASDKPLIAASTSAIPDKEYADFEVSRVTYAIHRKVDRPDSLKVTYYCGLRSFSEWQCFEAAHGRYAIHKGREWWRGRFAYSDQFPKGWTPDSTAQANEYAPWLRTPKAIRIWINKKQPEITGYDFGQGFPASD